MGVHSPRPAGVATSHPVLHNANTCRLTASSLWYPLAQTFSSPPCASCIPLVRRLILKSTTTRRHCSTSFVDQACCGSELILTFISLKLTLSELWPFHQPMHRLPRSLRLQRKRTGLKTNISRLTRSDDNGRTSPLPLLPSSAPLLLLTQSTSALPQRSPPYHKTFRPLLRHQGRYRPREEIALCVSMASTAIPLLTLD